MERSNGLKKGLKLAATGLFLMAALSSMGCGQNALMNPLAPTSANQGTVANPAGNTMNPAGNTMNP
jgi:hypothetical protein